LNKWKKLKRLFQTEFVLNNSFDCPQNEIGLSVLKYIPIFVSKLKENEYGN